jgi:hypothetical protein
MEGWHKKDSTAPHIVQTGVKIRMEVEKILETTPQHKMP